MGHGGARPGSGPKPSLQKAVQRLDSIKTEMQRGFYSSAFELAKSMPEMTRLAIEYASNGDRSMLRFLLDLFYKLVSAIPSEDMSVHKVVRERILKIVETYASDRPEVVDTSIRSDTERIVEGPLTSHVDAVFRPVQNTAGDGGREVGQILPRSLAAGL